MILSLYAQNASELGRAIETMRMVLGVAGTRVMIITGDERNTTWLDLLLAERAGFNVQSRTNNAL